METLKTFAYFRIHPFLGIVIVAIAGIFSYALLFINILPANATPIGGLITKVTPCVLDTMPIPTNSTNFSLCTISCPVCGSIKPPFTCVAYNEVVTSVGVYCPLKSFKPVAGSVTQGAYFVGFGTILSDFLLPFGTSA